MSTSLEKAINHSEHKSVLSVLMGQQVFWVMIAAALACITLSVVTDTFATERNLFNVTRNFSFVGIIALGMMVVIASGGIDLSVGSSVVLSAVILSVVMAAGWPFWLAAILALAAVLAVGAFNGIMVAYVGMPPFVVTLGMLSIARSLAMVISGNKMIYEFGPDHELILWLGGGKTFGLPHPLIGLLIVALLLGLVLRWTAWGQYVFAIGGNEKAAELSGIAVKRTKVSIYMFSSFTAGLTGILMVGWLGGVTTNLGQAMELTVIAAAVIGGANLAGGSGTALGAIVGALLIEIIRNSLILLGVSTFWQGAFVGSFIIIAVGFDRARRLNADR